MIKKIIIQSIIILFNIIIQKIVSKSFSDLDKVRLSGSKVVAESWNFGKILRDSFNSASNDEKKKLKNLKLLL